MDEDKAAAELIRRAKQLFRDEIYHLTEKNEQKDSRIVALEQDKRAMQVMIRGLVKQIEQLTLKKAA